MDSLHLSKYHITTLAECNPCSCSGPPTFQVVDNGDPKNLLKEKHTIPINFHGPIKMLGDGHTVTVINVQSKLSSPHIYSKNSWDEERQSTSREDNNESSCYHDCEGHIYQPILPWINGDGSTNSAVYEGLSRRVIGYIMHYPGVMEVCLLFMAYFQQETGVLLARVCYNKFSITLYDIPNHNILYLGRIYVCSI